jgi:hypothetical protein
MSEQHQTDLEQAKAKLMDVEKNKEARKDPRAGVANPPLRKPATDDSASAGEKKIRPIDKKPLKKTFGQKLKAAMFSEDIGNGSVTDYLFFKMLIPALKRVVLDMGNTALAMALGMDPKTKIFNGSTTTHTANARIYRDRNYSYNRGDAREYTRSRDAISDLQWDEETARDIFTQICEILEHYPSISVAEVYSIMNMSEYIRSTDKNWGWTSTNGMDVLPTDPGDPRCERYYIAMPPAKPLY